MIMDYQQIKTFVRFTIAVCTLLNLTNEELVCFYKECLVIAESVGDIATVIWCHNLLGRLYLDKLYRYQDAKETYQQVLRLIRPFRGEKQHIGQVHVPLGHCYFLLKQYNNAMVCYNKALSISKDIGDKKLEECAYNNLGKVANRLGKYGTALKHCEKALDIAKRLGDKNGEMCGFENLGMMYRKLGKPDEAITFLKTSFDNAIETGDRIHLASCYGKLGECYLSLGQSPEAKSYFDKQLEIALETCNKNEQQDKCITAAYLNLGDYYHSIGDHHLAIDYYKKIMPIARELSDKPSIGTAYANLGNVYNHLQQFNKAIVCYNIALSTFHELNGKEGEAISYSNLGSLYMNLYFNKLENVCLPVSSSNGYGEGKLTGEDDDVEMLQRETIAKSEYNFKEAIKRVEWLFDQLQGHQHFKITFFDQVVIAYKGLITVLMITGQTQQGLLYSERARSRVLVDLLTTKYGMAMVTAPSLSYRELKTVWSDGQCCILCYSYSGKELGGIFVWTLYEAKPPQHQDQDCQDCSITKQSECDCIDDSKESISELVAEAYRCLKVQVDVKCENRSLEAPVSYVTSSTSTTLTRGNDSNSNVKSHNRQHTIHPLEKLFTLLVSAVPSIQQEEVVIIPEGPLYTVPFAALRDPTGKYLSETKRIRLAPSITTLKRLQECPADYHSKTGALIIGNPDVGQVMFRGDIRTFEPLTWAETEANFIANKFRVTPLTGAQASKDEVLNKLKEGVAVIHIAAHGCPENGEIALAPPSTSREGGRIPEEEDYLLTMKEVQETGVRAQLVVLSCCHSGCGEIRAEGVVGLTRAFLAAGARSVVASLWPINDDAALSFMLSFYQYLKKGKSASASMQYAMNELRKDEYHSAAKHWASFFLMGDDVTISTWCSPTR